MGKPYGVPVVIDTYFAHCNNIYFEAKHHHTLLRIRGDDFGQLHQASMHAAISRPLGILENRDVRELMQPDEYSKHSPLTALKPLEDIRKQIEGVERLPTLPKMANRLLRLLNNPKVSIDDLTNIIQADPSLTAQIIRYGRSACFGFRGKGKHFPRRSRAY